MIGALLLLGSAVWLVLATGTGWLVHRGTAKRWAGIATTLFVVWLPFWDVIPGLILYHKAIREVGGVRIYRTVKAEGYLDRTLTDCSHCWNWLKDSPYRYLEIQTTAVPLTPDASLTPVPAYYSFRLLDKGSVGCEQFESLPNVEILRKRYGFADQCVTVQMNGIPSSRYEYESSRGWEPFLEFGSGVPVQGSWQRIRDRVTGEILAEAYSIRFVSWLGMQIGLPQWRYTKLPSGQPIGFDIYEVLIP